MRKCERSGRSSGGGSEGGLHSFILLHFDALVPFICS
jgi:hypothetical protein